MRIERARPLLGTRVTIRVEGLSEAESHSAINEAFEEVALVHRLMSFHEPESDVSRLNREARDGLVRVHGSTFEVLHHALAMSEASNGCFDITIAPDLVACGILPPPDARPPDPNADWRDIELADDHCVRFRQPVWLDLGGIAKGYAVDRALEAVRQHGASQVVVNAGGDLRVHGVASEQVWLRPDQPEGNAMSILQIENAAVASSSGHLERCLHGGILRGPHIDGVGRRPIATNRFVSVVAETCIVADALTKSVLARGADSCALLQRYGASAHLFDPGFGWLHLGNA